MTDKKYSFFVFSILLSIIFALSSSLFKRLDSIEKIVAQRELRLMTINVWSGLDFILINEAIPRGSVIESRICADNLILGVHPSDHFGVFTVLRFE